MQSTGVRITHHVSRITIRITERSDMASRLRERYENEIAPALMNEFGYANVMQVPRLVKVSMNIGLGEAVQNAKALDAAAADLATITGQKAVITRAKKSIANFKIRENMPIGMMVTLRGERMYEFLDRYLNVALPRIRDFQGAPVNAFDGRGNYSMGVREQLIFPEIEYDKIDRIRGLQITIVTTAKTDEEARRFLQLLGVPFQRQQALARAG
jgi:large subunit ribosomal protein L5